MCFGGSGGRSVRAAQAARGGAAQRKVASEYQTRDTQFQAGNTTLSKSFANYSQAVQDYAPGGKMTQGINAVYASQQARNPDTASYAQGYTVRPGIDYEVVTPDYSGIDKNLPFKKQFAERLKIGNAARKQTDLNMRMAQGKTNAPSGIGGEDYYSQKDYSPTTNGGNISVAKAENPQIAIDKQRDDWIKSNNLTDVRISDNGTSKTVSGQKYIGSIEAYQAEFGKAGKDWQNDPKFSKTAVTTKRNAQNRTAIADEGALRIKTRAARADVANAADTSKVKGKKGRSKLRIDVAGVSSTSGGSGVFFNKG